MLVNKKICIIVITVFVLAGCVNQPTTPEIEAPKISPTTFAISSITPSLRPFPSSTPDPYFQILVAPNGLFIAKLYSVFDGTSYVEAVEIWDSDGELIENIPYQGDINQGDPRDAMIIAGWSSDSTKLFFYYSWAYDGWITLFDGSNLQYYDVPTGEIREFVPGIVTFDFTPDKSKIAYLSCCEIIISNLESGEKYSEEIPEIEHNQAGWVHISPSGRKVVYHLLVEEYSGTAILFDSQDLKQIILVENEFIETIIFEGWDDNENPIIKYFDSVNNLIYVETQNQ
jgi:hypothetical protein